VALLSTVAKGIGLPGEAMLEPCQPWFVSATLEMVPMLKGWIRSGSGIDLKLLAESKREQKRILGFRDHVRPAAHAWPMFPQASR